MADRVGHEGPTLEPPELEQDLSAARQVAAARRAHGAGSEIARVEVALGDRGVRSGAQRHRRPIPRRAAGSRAGAPRPAPSARHARRAAVRRARAAARARRAGGRGRWRLGRAGARSRAAARAGRSLRARARSSRPRRGRLEPCERGHDRELGPVAEDRDRSRDLRRRPPRAARAAAAPLARRRSGPAR